MNSKDVVKMEYELWAKESNELVDTTSEEVAQDNGRHNPQAKYGPMPVVVDSGKMLKLLDDDLLKAKVDEDREVEIPSEDAYGKRDPNLVELHSIHEILKLPEFKKRDMIPEIGMEIALKGKRCTIISMTTGRVRVDFNHPLAGKTLVYKYKVVSSAKDESEKAAWIIEANYTKSEDFKVKVKDSGAEIVLPDVCKYDEEWFMSKYRVVSDLRDVLDLKTIRFVEEYVKKEEEKKEEEKKETKKSSSKKDEEKTSTKKSTPKKTEEKKTTTKKSTSSKSSSSKAKSSTKKDTTKKSSSKKD